MTKKIKIKIIVWSIVVFLVAGIISVWFLFKGDLMAMGGFIASLPVPEEQKQIYKENKEKFKQAKKRAKLSYLNTKDDPVITPPDIIYSDSYRQARGYIDNIDKIAGRLKFLQGMYNILGSSNPDAVVDAMPYLIGDIYEKFKVMPKEAYYALMEAMYDKNISWETKYWLCHILGNREVKEALPIFRDIASDENEMFWLRIVAMDQIGNMKDRDANDLMIKLIDNTDREIRDKATSIIMDTAEPGDDFTYEKVLVHYYREEDEEIKGGFLTAVITIGGEKSLSDVREILKNPNCDRERIAVVLETVRTHESFEILRDLYDPKNHQLSNLVLSSLAELEMDEANNFLFGVIEEANGKDSVMAAEYLKDKGQKGAIPYIEMALEKEIHSVFSRDYEEILSQLKQ